MKALEHAVAFRGRDARDRRRSPRSESGRCRHAGPRARPVRCPHRCDRPRCARDSGWPAPAGRGRRRGIPRGSGPSSNRRSSIKLIPSHRSLDERRAARSVRCAGSWSASAWASTSRSSTSLLMRVISACTSRSTRRTSASRTVAPGRRAPRAARGSRSAACAARARRRRRTRAGRERLGEPVEHVVERFRQHLDLAAAAPADSSIRGSSSPASTRAATPASRRSGAVTRAPAR